MYGSLSSRGVYLAAAQVTGASASAMATAGAETASERVAAEKIAAERLFWESVKDREEAADIQAYLDRYPDGVYAVLARNRLERLERSARAEEGELVVASAPPPEAPEEPSSPASAESSPRTVESGLGLERSQRRRVQRALASLGFDPGPADGLFGDRTRSAVRSYQMETELRETGYLDAASARALLAVTVPSDATATTAADPSRVFLASGITLSGLGAAGGGSIAVRRLPFASGRGSGPHAQFRRNPRRCSGCGSRDRRIGEGHPGDG